MRYQRGMPSPTVSTIGDDVDHVELRCACGAAVNGTVKAGTVDVAQALFDAHHQGPECSVSCERRHVEWNAWEPYAVYPRVTPERICASAWWLRLSRSDEKKKNQSR